MAHFILTIVAERRICIRSFSTLEDAQAKMKEHFYKALLHPEYLDEDISQGEVDIGSCSAFINYDYAKSDENLDWKITYLDDNGIILPLSECGDIISLEESQIAPSHKKTLSTKDTSELFGQMIDIIEDFLEERFSSLTKDCSNSEVLIRGDDYEFLRNRLSETLQHWDLLL